MNEIDKLLKKLKQDQNTLLENFREEVLRIQSGQQKKYAHKDFEVLNEIVCRHFGIPSIFVKFIYYSKHYSYTHSVMHNLHHQQIP